MKTNLAVIFGCRSVEHEVAIISAVQAMRSVNKEKYNLIPLYVTKGGEIYTGDALTEIEEFRDMPTLLSKLTPVSLIRKDGAVYMKYIGAKSFFKKDVILDVAFPIVHGTNCEDGTIAGYLEFLGLPYVGCDILSAAVGMDKAVFKDVLKAAGLPVLPCLRFTAREYNDNGDALLKNIEAKIGFPVIVKPINLGSSVGITKAHDMDGLVDAINLAISFSDKVLVEHAVNNLREINCSVLGDADECHASVCEEPFMNDEILSYEDKYMGGGKQKGMASLGRKLPADIPEDAATAIRELSCKIFKTLGCNGVVRIDYLVDNDTGKVYANEINTIPGSLSFYLWEATGLSYTDMIDKLIALAFRRQRNRENLTFTIETNILSGVSFGTKGAKGSKM
ncbi:MAG: D-alanine--D-alanine ligase family protein [Acutalibacteraceae bacterium]|nr:D-alanine--D-alanine ligase family protein [Acutalibacteraceae bacterium]